MPHLTSKGPTIEEADDIIRFIAGITQDTAESVNGLSAEEIGNIRKVIDNISVDAPIDSKLDANSRLYVAPRPEMTSTYGSGSMAVDLTFKNADGNSIQPASAVTVRIPVPEKLKDKDPIFVYHIADDGTTEKMEITTETVDGIRYVVFDTDKFSVYVISEQNLSSDDKFPSNKVIDGVKYTLLENGTYSVSCDDPDKLPEKLVIHSEINDKGVSVIEEGAFSGCEEIWGEENLLKWTPVDNTAMYWCKILVNGKQFRYTYTNAEKEYVGNLPNETYDVEMYVVDKNHITFNEKTYSVQIGKNPVDSIGVTDANGNVCNPLTQREIAKQLGISRSYISRIEKRALEKLRARFDGE